MKTACIFAFVLSFTCALTWRLENRLQARIDELEARTAELEALADYEWHSGHVPPKYRPKHGRTDGKNFTRLRKPRPKLDNREA